MANPWGKFFWADWDTDPALKLCSFAAQGLWMRMLCIAASHDPIGYVAVNGRGLDAPAIARMTGGVEPEVSALLDELDQNGVFSRDRHGRIFSRRMIRDAKVSKARSKSGSVGASVTNEKRYGNSDLPQQNLGKGSANGSANSRPQKPEARSHKPEPIARGSLCPPDLRAVIDAAGMATQPPDHQLLREWLALPNMELERDILPIVRRVAERGRQSDGRAPFRLKFFDAAIREQHAADEAEIARMRRGVRLIEEQDERQRQEREASAR
jgi:hypothetical protein